MKLNTKFIHGNQHPDKAYGAVMTPIYQTTTYKQETPGDHRGYEYSRSANPTRHALEQALASIENGTRGVVFGSGLAAIDAVLKLLKPGDEVITSRHLYGGTYRLFIKIFEDFGIKFHFIEMDCIATVQKSITSNTKLIWIETPTNPLMNVVDITKVATILKNSEIILAVDNTFATPYLQQPLDLGADIVMHSITKYIGGHSDIILGALVVKDEDLAKRLFFIQNASGAIGGPQDCFLALRGLKTLHVRMQRHCENAHQIAQFLKSHDKVDCIFYPGCTDHPGHIIAKEQMRDFGGMISFTTKNDTQNAAFEILKRLQVFTLAESLGGVESLAGHPATMTHASIPLEERLSLGIKDSLIRLSVGIEDVEDLIEDLNQALA